jgi:hypothetical protein
MSLLGPCLLVLAISGVLSFRFLLACLPLTHVSPHPCLHCSLSKLNPCLLTACRKLPRSGPSLSVLEKKARFLLHSFFFSWNVMAFWKAWRMRNRTCCLRFPANSGIKVENYMLSASSQRNCLQHNSRCPSAKLLLIAAVLLQGRLKLHVLKFWVLNFCKAMRKFLL